jgi:hypothetical protein
VTAKKAKRDDPAQSKALVEKQKKVAQATPAARDPQGFRKNVNPIANKGMARRALVYLHA